MVYYHGQTNLGDVGVEGSKPGAAASGVLLANKVINLGGGGEEILLLFIAITK